MFKLLPIDIQEYIIHELVNNTTRGLFKRVSKHCLKLIQNRKNTQSKLSWRECCATADLAYWSICNLDMTPSTVCYFQILHYGIEYVQLAMSKGMQMTNTHSTIAAARGKLDVLKYIHEQGYNWDKHTTRAAAMNGHLDCLMYAHENGCEWNEETCSVAAEDGNIECLKYAHEHGCPWDAEVLKWASINLDSKCFSYAIKHGCQHDNESMEIMYNLSDSDCHKLYELFI